MIIAMIILIMINIKIHINIDVGILWGVLKWGALFLFFGVRNFVLPLGKYSFVTNNDSKLKNHPQNRKDYEKKVSVSTVNNYLRNIKAFINWCVGERLLKDNIAKNVKHLKASRKPKEQLSDQGYKRLIGSLDTTKYVEFRDYTIINTIMDSGM
ncbi:hypothetical protein [Clostridium pasteurianum]|uniref:hypothetical protein n=1 Tax=Clostridium pasteurianum TaxID=1501 RepID=UPI0003A269F6|nr:hypothetical protein [Clostridium pasteurianum]